MQSSTSRRGVAHFPFGRMCHCQGKAAGGGEASTSCLGGWDGGGGGRGLCCGAPLPLFRGPQGDLFEV